MAEKCGDGFHSIECLEKNFVALQKKVEEDFSQVESIQMKIKALSIDWEERHQQLKVEQEKVAELEAEIKLLNTKQEEAMASLQADVLRAARQIQQKEGLAERLRREVTFLEKRVRAACQEAAESAAGLEKGAHEARLALEATLASLCPQLDKVMRQSLQSELKTPPPQHSEPFLGGQDTEWPGKAEGAEATAEETLQDQPQEVEGGLQEEAKPRASRGMALASSTDHLVALGRHALAPWSHWSGEQAVSRSPQKRCGGVSLGLLCGKGFCPNCSCTGFENCTVLSVTGVFLRCILLEPIVT